MVSGRLLLSNILLPSAALAVSSSRLGATLSSRNEHDHSWAGARLGPGPDGRNYHINHLMGTFAVPQHKNETGAAQIWMGLEGNRSESSDCRIVRVGVDIQVSSDGSTSYSAWCKVSPKDKFNLNNTSDNFHVQKDDDISSTFQTTNSKWMKTSHVDMQNLNNHKILRLQFDGNSSAVPFCDEVARWAVEPLGHLPLLKFTTVSFKSTAAISSPPFETFTMLNATLYEIDVNNVHLTKTWIESEETNHILHISRVGY